ncbi:hypothetical protein CBL_13071 [Carabus blaptoides fortunei]
MRCLPQEIALTDLLIVYRMHEADLEVKNTDILAHREVTFILNVPPRELASEYVIMKISAYKYHPTGLKVLIGNIEVNIKVFIDFALMKMGQDVPLPVGFGEGELFRANPRGGTGNNINRLPNFGEMSRGESNTMQARVPW